MRKKHDVPRLAWIYLGFLIVAITHILIGRAGAEDWQPMYILCSPGAEVNVRTRPTTHAERGGYLMLGDQIDVIGQKQVGGVTWYRIDGVCEQGSGWVSGLYVVEDCPWEVGSQMQVTASGRVATRDGAGGKRKGWIKPGAKVTVKAMTDDWALTDKGWIRSEYLTGQD